MSLELLPEDCLARILSCTSPSDVCRLSLVSSAVRLAADSDTVWEKFLPGDYQQVLSRLVAPMGYCSSKKELFMRLCSPLLVDDGKMTIALEKSTGKKRYMLSARALSITWSSNPLYWTWKPFFPSRFEEVAELRTISWLEITGKINTKTMTPRTVYKAYLVVKFAGRAFGLDTLTSEVSVEVIGNGDKVKSSSKGTVYLRWQERRKQLLQISLERVYFLHRIEAMARAAARVSDQGNEGVASERDDGWIEIELGSFYSDDHDGDDQEEIKMCLREVKGHHLKGGLIVGGIEIRPN